MNRLKLSTGSTCQMPLLKSAEPFTHILREPKMLVFVENQKHERKKFQDE